jgi:hypothetical protein
MTDQDNRDRSATDLGKMNQQIGRELYERDKQQQQSHQQERYARRGENQRKWDEGNYFHTGPSPRGAQDRPGHQPEHHRSSGHSTYHTGEGAHLGDHYGSRSDSPYRREDTYLNHGNRPYSGQGYYSQGSTASGQQPGNYNEPPRPEDNPWNESPLGRSRYKETDYRYGSGSHNWYQEGRYSPDEPPRPQQTSDRSFFQRLRHTWDDIMHSDDPEWQERDQRDRAHYIQQHSRSDRERHGSEPYRDRNFDRGYEGGPRWADETDSGKK